MLLNNSMDLNLRGKRDLDLTVQTGFRSGKNRSGFCQFSAGFPPLRAITLSPQSCHTKKHYSGIVPNLF